MQLSGPAVVTRFPCWFTIHKLLFSLIIFQGVYSLMLLFSLMEYAAQFRCYQIILASSIEFIVWNIPTV